MRPTAKLLESLYPKSLKGCFQPVKHHFPRWLSLQNIVCLEYNHSTMHIHCISRGVEPLLLRPFFMLFSYLGLQCLVTPGTSREIENYIEVRYHDCRNTTVFENHPKKFHLKILFEFSRQKSRYNLDRFLCNKSVETFLSDC